MAGSAADDVLVSGRWLQDHLTDPGLRIIETAWGSESYLRAHLPGAVRMPWHPHLKHFDPAGAKTCQVISATEFEELCHALGLRRDRICVVYDDYHGLFAARFRTVCRFYGWSGVQVLDGGWHGWLDQGRPVTARLSEPAVGTDITAGHGSDLLIGRDELLARLGAADLQVWDTRRPQEFDGREETENLRRGHIPTALNLSWTELLTGDDDDSGAPRFVKPPAELTALLQARGLRRDRTIVTYCQAGIRAAFCLMILERLGFAKIRLYDGSMGEWGNRPDTPLVSPTT